MTRNVAQGYRFFKCECGTEWKSKCRDCLSPSIEDCSNCHGVVAPHQYEIHYEWPVDIDGKLI